MIVSYLEDLGSSTTKLMLRVFYWVFGTRMEWSSLTGGFLEGFL